MSRFNRTRTKTEIARRLRRDGTEVEKRLWYRLRNGQICAAQFRRQHPAGRYVLDLYCPAVRLSIELDGGQHAEITTRDEARDEWLQKQGVTVLRFWNSDVTENINGVLEVISAKIVELSSPAATPIRRWRGAVADPHPAPPDKVGASRPPPFRGR
jgi:very-short-patch-repair endonuclease